MSSESRNLDILRAVAVLSVLASHILFNVFGTEHLGLFAAHEIGRMGVLIFFVHTSLVLMLSLERTRTERPFFNFYVRRALRIFPLSMVCVAAVVLLAIPPMPDEPFVAVTRPELLSNLLLLQNLTGHRVVLGPLWSLPYEVQMYAVLPFLYFGIRRRTVKFVGLLWIAAVAVQAVALIPQLRPVYDLIRFIPWFFGGVFAYRCSRTFAPRLPAWLWPIGLFGVFAVHALMWTGGHVSVRRNLGEYIACGLLSAILPLFRDLSRSFITASAKVVAKYSYGVYLFHPPILWFSFVYLKGIAQWPSLVTLLVLVPVLSYHLVEAPAMRLGRVLAGRFATRRETILLPVMAAE